MYPKRIKPLDGPKSKMNHKKVQSFMKWVFSLTVAHGIMCYCFMDYRWFMHLVAMDVLSRVCVTALYLIIVLAIRYFSSSDND